MKTFTGVIVGLVFVFLSACEGPVGPPGPRGEDGLDGGSFLGSVFEIEGDFTFQNQYNLSFVFPEEITVYETDVVLVYILWEVVDGNDGEALDVWRLLPQTVVVDEGVLQYNYDYTYSDVQIFLEGTIDFNTLLDAEALNQVFRIVVFPAAELNANKSLDISDYNLMMKSLGVKQDVVRKAEINSNEAINNR